jgi:hypothetical protein
MKIINQKYHSGSQSLTSWSSQAGPSQFFFPNPQKTSIKLLLEAQQITPLDDYDGVSFLLKLKSRK